MCRTLTWTPWTLTWIVLYLTTCIMVFNLSRQPLKLLAPRYVSREERLLLYSVDSKYASGREAQLDLLLQRILRTEEHTPVRFVVALVVNFAYRHLALNFVCNLIRLGIRNYLIFSLDVRAFEFFVQDKVNTFMFTEDGMSHGLGNHRYPRDKEDTFGTQSFLETSRKKTFHVLKALELGYSVLFSDVDVAWVRNPLPYLLKTNADIVIQSDLPSRQKDKPRNYNINSGLYLVRSNHRTVAAFRAILKYSSAIRRSEQKAFNYVLCGGFKGHKAGPGLRVGKTDCIYIPRGTSVGTLPLEAFPNGSDSQLWISTNNITNIHTRIIAIHANYAFGRKAKTRRLQRIGFWFISQQVKSTRDCATTMAGVKNSFTYPRYRVSTE